MSGLDRFGRCALLAGFVARQPGFLHDPGRVRDPPYAPYKRGALGDAVGSCGADVTDEAARPFGELTRGRGAGGRVFG